MGIRNADNRSVKTSKLSAVKFWLPSQARLQEGEGREKGIIKNKNMESEHNLFQKHSDAALTAVEKHSKAERLRTIVQSFQGQLKRRGSSMKAEERLIIESQVEELRSQIEELDGGTVGKPEEHE